MLKRFEIFLKIAEFFCYQNCLRPQKSAGVNQSETVTTASRSRFLIDLRWQMKELAGLILRPTVPEYSIIVAVGRSRLLSFPPPPPRPAGGCGAAAVPRPRPRHPQRNTDQSRCLLPAVLESLDPPARGARAHAPQRAAPPPGAAGCTPQGIHWLPLSVRPHDERRRSGLRRQRRPGAPTTPGASWARASGTCAAESGGAAGRRARTS